MNRANFKESKIPVWQFLAGLRATLIDGEKNGVLLPAQEVRKLCAMLSASSRQARAMSNELAQLRQELAERNGQRPAVKVMPAFAPPEDNVVAFPAAPHLQAEERT